MCRGSLRVSSFNNNSLPSIEASSLSSSLSFSFLFRRRGEKAGQTYFLKNEFFCSFFVFGAALPFQIKEKHPPLFFSPCKF